MTAKRKLVVMLSLLSSLLLLLGALVLPWWTGQLDNGDFEVNLRGMEMCLRGVCGESKALSMVGEDAKGWSRVGVSTFAVSLVAAWVLVLSAIQAVRHRDRGSVVHWLAGSLALFSGLLSLLFVWLHPDFGTWSPSYGMASALAGSFLGAMAASATSRLHRR